MEKNTIYICDVSSLVDMELCAGVDPLDKMSAERAWGRDGKQEE